MTPQAPRSQAPQTAGLNPAALLRIFSLVMATLLFIAMTERDSRHNAHQRWLAEQRRRPADHRLAVSAPRSFRETGSYQHGSHGAAMMARSGEAVQFKLTDRATSSLSR